MKPHTDEQYMQRCLDLACMGKGMVAPNPLVGCVIVYEGKIIGEGWHRVYGEPHAEVNAIEQVQDKSLLSQSTVYVNLEPCAHFGKTPPCADLLIKHRVARVVIGMVDPFNEVAGKGIARLKTAGIAITVGVLEEECKELNKRFILFNEQKRPYIILKWAQTSDGFLGPDVDTMSAEKYDLHRHITGKTVQALVHKWRGEEAAIMVGTKTAKADNPRLDTRAFPGNNPVRVVIDRELKLPGSLNLLDGSIRTIVFTTKQYQAAHLQTEYVTINFDQPVWPQVLTELYNRKLQSIVVEGGAFTLNTILDSGLWDELQVFTAPHILTEGIRAPGVKGKLTEQFLIDGSQFKRYRNL